MNEIQLLNQVAPLATVTATSLQMPAAATFEDYERVVNALHNGIRTFRMWLADALNQAGQRFGEDAIYQLVNTTGNEWRTVENWQYTYRNVPACARVLDVAHSKHTEVAPLQSPALQRAILLTAREHELRTEDVRKIVAAVKHCSTDVQEALSEDDEILLSYLKQSEEDVPFADEPDNPLYSDDRAPESWHAALDELWIARHENSNWNRLECLFREV